MMEDMSETDQSKTRRVIVEYDWTAALGDCVLLTVLKGDEDDRFAIPFDSVEDVSTAMLGLLADVRGDHFSTDEPLGDYVARKGFLYPEPSPPQTSQGVGGPAARTESTTSHPASPPATDGQ